LDSDAGDEDGWEEVEQDDEEGPADCEIGQVWHFGVPPVRGPGFFLGNQAHRHHISPETGIPFDYFCLFIPIWMWAKIALYTNMKAEMSEKAKTTATSRPWQATSAAEIKAWFASIIWWCLVKSCSFEQFFNFDLNPHRLKAWFTSFKRWEQIKRFLKLFDPIKDKDNIQDRLFRVRELFEFFISACRANYWPGENVSFDEALKKFKGRCSFKQYIKNKPVKWGIKIFCVCCSATAYLWNAMFYCGKSRNVTEDDRETAADISVTAQTVIDLMRPLQGLNHHVHMDNYYSSVSLFDQLAKMGIRSTGTIRTNRKNLDKQVTITKKEEKGLEPGFSRYSSRGALCFLSWFHKRSVHALSNGYDPHGDDVIESWFTAKHGEQAETVSGKSRMLCSFPQLSNI
jgi:Transposase IS4